jgi:histone chaperone ASF1
MASVNVTNIRLLDNPAKFSSPFQFEITFQLITPLSKGKEEQEHRTWLC